MTPKRVDRAARREEILTAAVRVFARRGFAATRVDDVAAEAGIAKGSVYLYFTGREELLAAAFEAFGLRSERLLAQVRAEGGDALERLERLIRSTVAMLAAEPDLARVLLDLWAAGRGTEGASPLDMAAVYREYRAVVAALLTEGVEQGTVRAVPELAATVVVGAVEGCLLQWLVDPAVPFAELAGPMTDVLVTGLRPRSHA